MYKILSPKKVQDITGLSKSTIWRLEKKGEFPQRIRTSPMRVGWHEEEILDWKQTRPKASIRPNTENCPNPADVSR